MEVDEAPVESIPDFAPWPLGVIRHFEDVGGTGDVRFGGELAPIGVECHSVDVWSHDPIGGIDEVRIEPVERLDGVDLAEVHCRSEDHEAFDVMAISVFGDSFDGVIEGSEAGGAVVPGVCHSA